MQNPGNSEAVSLGIDYKEMLKTQIALKKIEKDMWIEKGTYVGIVHTGDLDILIPAREFALLLATNAVAKSRIDYYSTLADIILEKITELKGESNG